MLISLDFVGQGCTVHFGARSHICSRRGEFISVALCRDAGDDQSFLMAGCYWNLDGIPKWKEDLWNG